VPQAVGLTGCESCHGPASLHVLGGGGRGKSIVNPGKDPEPCFECHRPIQAEFRLPQHHPLLEHKMNCSQCHDPHGSENAGLLVDKQKDLCLGCHTDVPQTHAHPFSAPAKDPRTGRDLSCTSCHDPHSSDQPQLLKGDKKRELCVQCHLGGNMEAHSPGGK